MRKILFLFMLLCSVSMFAQDVIVKKDGSTIVCRIIELNDSEIIYKRWSDLNGSNYVMDKSLASIINYEDGKKVNISETSNLYMPNNQNTGVQQYNDKALLAIDIASQKKYSTSSIKKLKTWGWVGVGIGCVGGIVLGSCDGLGAGLEFMSDETYISLGLALAGSGILISTYCFTTAHKRQKIVNNLQASSLIQQEFQFNNGSSLLTGIDVINDRLTKERTLGLGLSYNF